MDRPRFPLTAKNAASIDGAVERAASGSSFAATPLRAVPAAASGTREPVTMGCRAPGIGVGHARRSRWVDGGGTERPVQVRHAETVARRIDQMGARRSGKPTRRHRLGQESIRARRAPRAARGALGFRRVNVSTSRQRAIRLTTGRRRFSCFDQGDCSRFSCVVDQRRHGRPIVDFETRGRITECRKDRRRHADSEPGRHRSRRGGKTPWPPLRVSECAAYGRILGSGARRCRCSIIGPASFLCGVGAFVAHSG